MIYKTKNPDHCGRDFLFSDVNMIFISCSDSIKKEAQSNAFRNVLFVLLFYALYNAFIDWTFFCTLEGNRTPI